MWGTRYWSARYWARRFWAKVGATQIIPSQLFANLLPDQLSCYMFNDPEEASLVDEELDARLVP